MKKYVSQSKMGLEKMQSMIKNVSVLRKGRIVHET